MKQKEQKRKRKKKKVEKNRSKECKDKKKKEKKKKGKKKKRSKSSSLLFVHFSFHRWEKCRLTWTRAAATTIATSSRPSSVSARTGPSGPSSLRAL